MNKLTVTTNESIAEFINLVFKFEPDLWDIKAPKIKLAKLPDGKVWISRVYEFNNDLMEEVNRYLERIKSTIVEVEKIKFTEYDYNDIVNIDVENAVIFISLNDKNWIGK